MKSGIPEKKKPVKKLHVGKEINFRLIGISSHENDYRLVWAINNQLAVNFIREQNLVIHRSRLNADLEFSRFIYSDEDKILTYYLISNRCPDGFLLPEMTNIDYILQITGELDAKYLDRILKAYRKVDIISAIFEIDLKQLKSKGTIFAI